MLLQSIETLEILESDAIARYETAEPDMQWFYENKLNKIQDVLEFLYSLADLVD